MLDKFKKLNSKQKLATVVLSTFVVMFLVISATVFFTSQNKNTGKKAEIKGETANNISSQISSEESSSSQESSTSSEITSSSSSSTSSSLSSKNRSSSTNFKSNYKQFSGLEFQALYESVSENYSGVTKLSSKPEITGDKLADAQIQKIAENRGYKIRSESSDKKLKSVTQTAFNNLKNAAKKEANLNLILVSGFRSISDQKSIFKGELGNSFTNTQITNGEADAKLNKIMETRSAPGYSRHHTGYTFDLGCNSSNLLNFKTTACYTWISKNNYENAKRFGLIPSYPSGAVNQGPNPEEWEYVWVGEDNLK